MTMKKYFTLVLLAVSLTAFASNPNLRVFNYTGYYFNWHMITYPSPGGCMSWSQVSNASPTMDMYSLAPGNSVVYDVPGAPGLPYNLFANWRLATSPSSNSIITGGAAYTSFGTSHKWGKCKYSVTSSALPLSPGSIIYASGNLGPCGDFGNLVVPAAGGTVNWIATGTGVTLVYM